MRVFIFIVSILISTQAFAARVLYFADNIVSLRSEQKVNNFADFTFSLAKEKNRLCQDGSWLDWKSQEAEGRDCKINDLTITWGKITANSCEYVKFQIGNQMIAWNSGQTCLFTDFGIVSKWGVELQAIIRDPSETSNLFQISLQKEDAFLLVNTLFYLGVKIEERGERRSMTLKNYADCTFDHGNGVNTAACKLMFQ